MHVLMMLNMVLIAAKLEHRRQNMHKKVLKKVMNKIVVKVFIFPRESALENNMRGATKGLK